MMLALVLGFVFVCSSQAFVVQPWAGNHGCNDPGYWCKNQETAKECGVLEYCKIEWGQTQTTDFIFNKESAKKDIAKPDAAPVKVTLYYESLCPGCRAFIKGQWYPTYTKLRETGILDLELVPYGNAREYQYGDKWVFSCQHGTAECLGNVIESCVINIVGKLDSYAPFISCLEYYTPNVNNAKYCASAHAINYTQIDECVNGEQGNKFEHEMALKTDALSPPHQYVPWITVNGAHSDSVQSSVQSDMLTYVCKTYKGTKPAACNASTKKPQNVCFRD